MSNVIEVIDVGDQVNCDTCNKQWTPEMQQQGGILFGSKGVCPDCAPRLLADAEKYGEMEYVKARQPNGMTFHAWCMQLRGGNNAIVIREFDRWPLS